MEDVKKIEAILEKRVTNIIEFGKDGNMVVVETVGRFRNLMNLIHKPRVKERYIEEKYIDREGKEQKREIKEIQNIYYPFEESPEFELILSQTQKIILENKEVDTTANNLIKFFDREPQMYQKIQRAIMDNSGDMGFEKK